MKGKKIVCIILCMVMCFTLLSGPWRAEAEAAAIAIPLTVLGIVGLFVVSSGYTFSNVGDFRATVTDFCNKNFNMANGAAFMNVLSAIPTTSGAVELAAALQSEFFPEFWQAIKDFFGGGEVEVESGTPAPSEGMAYYNGVELPLIPSSAPYYRNEMVILSYDSSKIAPNYTGSTYYRLLSFFHEGYPDASHLPSFAYTLSPSCKYKHYYVTSDEDFYNYCISNDIDMGFSSWELIGEKTTGGTWFDITTLIWTNFDIVDSNGNFAFYASEVITNGDLYVDTIPVTVDSTYNPAAVYNGWMSKVEAEPWMTYDASSAVFQDITTAETDKTAPMTATQAGVISQGGVKVETETDVVIPEYTGEYAVNGLTSIFPFCIPFDIYDFFSVLVAEREAPHFEFNIDFGKYGAVPVNIDLSEWESVAKVLRTLELLGFIVGLAWATSKLIKW